MNEEKFNEKYVTVICFNQFHGKKIFKIGSILKLIKEPDNNHDSEAIRVEICDCKVHFPSKCHC